MSISFHVVLTLTILLAFASCNRSQHPSQTVESVGTPVLSPDTAPSTSQFPKHDEPLRTDRGNEYFFGRLIARDGCLRLDYGLSGYLEGLTLLLVWPDGFSLGVEGGRVSIVDSSNSVVARLGDDVRVSGRSIGENVRVAWAVESGPDPPQLPVRKRQQLEEWQRTERLWQQRLSVDCPGPFLMVGDEVTVVGPDESTVVSIGGSALLFVRQRSIKGPIESELSGTTAELVLDGDCLRLGRGENHEDYLIEWPAGFVPHIEGGDVEIRNSVGRTIARVGDSVKVVGPLGRFEDNPYRARCPGRFWHVTKIENLTRPLLEPK